MTKWTSSRFASSITLLHTIDFHGYTEYYIGRCVDKKHECECYQGLCVKVGNMGRAISETKLMDKWAMHQTAPPA